MIRNGLDGHSDASNARSWTPSRGVERYGGRRTILRKYLVTFAALVGVALLVSGLVESYLSYRERSASLAQLQREKAASAATAIQGFIIQIEDQLVAANPPGLAAEPDSLQQRYAEYIKLL